MMDAEVLGELRMIGRELRAIRYGLALQAAQWLGVPGDGPAVVHDIAAKLLALADGEPRPERQGG